VMHLCGEDLARVFFEEADGGGGFGAVVFPGVVGGPGGVCGVADLTGEGARE
jgi:hypothetical protein